MSEELIKSLDQYLRAGKTQLALQTASRLCEANGATRETGIEVARIAAAVYRDLIVPPVVEFADQAPNVLPPEVGQLVQKAMQRLIRMTEEWEQKLWGVHTERLIRELRDWVRGRHLEAAAANVGRLMALVPATQQERRAHYIGSVLATVINNQKEAKELLALLAKNPSAYYVDGAILRAMEGAREKRTSEMIGVNLENMEREFTSALTQAAVDIKNALPDNTKMGEPEEAMLRDTGDIFRSILRVPVQRQEPELFLDATNILVEFIPREQTAMAKVARIEGRTYNTLGFTAKKACLLTFQDIGKNKFFTTLYQGWAESYLGADQLRVIVELMGALRTNDFADFLRRIKGDKKQADLAGGQLNAAIGAMGGEEGSETLITELRALLSRKRIESAELREAERLIVALSNIVKSPRTNHEDKQKILEFLRTHVPEDLTKLALTTALQAFIYKSEEQTPQQRQWAIRALVRGLWLSDQTTAHHKGGERQESELGFRHEIVEALKKIGPKDPQAIIRAVEPLAARYGGAYIAVAEVFEKVNNPEFLMVLERMLNNALLHDEAATNAYQQEFYWDATTQERKPLTKQKVLGPLVYTIGMIGTDKGKEILKRYQEQISSGRVNAPSTDVANYLQRFLGAAVFSSPVGATPEVVAEPIDPAEVETLIKQITAGYLLTGKDKRRMKKIEALTRLARIGSADSIDPVLEQLGDKDSMVVSAAITCLTEFAMPYQPKTLRDLTINSCLDKFESKDPAVRQGCVKLLKDVGPNRKDVRDKVIAFAKQTERREVKEAIAHLLKTGGGAPVGTGTGTGDTASGLSDTGGDLGKGAATMLKLEAKKQYMAARKAWIDDGKKGDPPARPAGID